MNPNTKTKGKEIMINKKIEGIIELLNQFENKNRFYWIKVLINEKEICTSEAGYLIQYFNL